MEQNMKTITWTFVVLMISVLFSGVNANAETLTVEFQWCSDSPDYVCAIVYGPGNGQEMGVTSDQSVNEQIQSLILPHGRSVALNIDGRIRTANRWGGGGQSKKLEVYSLQGDPSVPRPRGL
jgi:hypothetical protein